MAGLSNFSTLSYHVKSAPATVPSSRKSASDRELERGLSLLFTQTLTGARNILLLGTVTPYQQALWRNWKIKQL